MIKTLRNYLTIAATLLMFSLPALAPAVSYANCNSNIDNNIASGATSATGGNVSCTGSNVSATSSIDSIAKTVVMYFSIIVGVIAVIMIIYAGFRYITSGGESGSVSGAKNALIYALVGLVIVALAQFIVHFVLNSSTAAIQQ